MVIFESEVLVSEVIDGCDSRIKVHHGEGPGFAGKLLVNLVEMVLIEVEVAEGVNKIAGLQMGNLSDHEGKQRVGGDVEGNSQKEVGTALIKLAGERAFLFVYVELKEAVAGG